MDYNAALSCAQLLLHLLPGDFALESPEYAGRSLPHLGVRHVTKKLLKHYLETCPIRTLTEHVTDCTSPSISICQVFKAYLHYQQRGIGTASKLSTWLL